MTHMLAREKIDEVAKKHLSEIIFFEKYNSEMHIKFMKEERELYFCFFLDRNGEIEVGHMIETTENLTSKDWNYFNEILTHICTDLMSEIEKSLTWRLRFLTGVTRWKRI